MIPRFGRTSLWPCATYDLLQRLPHIRCLLMMRQSLDFKNGVDTCRPDYSYAGLHTAPTGLKHPGASSALWSTAMLNCNLQHSSRSSIMLHASVASIDRDHFKSSIGWTEIASTRRSNVATALAEQYPHSERSSESPIVSDVAPLVHLIRSGKFASETPYRR